MMKVTGKILIKVISILLLTFMLLIFFSNIVRPTGRGTSDNTHDKVEGFYALEENSLDVLFLGSSHSFYAFNPSVLWNETGLTSYVFAGQCQPIEVTYHYLVEALKTQNPKLVVLDIFALGNQVNKCLADDSYRVNIQNMDFSMNKYEAYKLIEDENPLENMLDILTYNNKLKEINPSEYDKYLRINKNTSFGYTLNYTKQLIPYLNNFEHNDAKLAVDETRFNYLIGINDLLKESNIPLLLVKTPYYIDEVDYQMFNTIWEYAQDNSIDAIDFNKISNEIGFDYNSDCDYWHTNVTGSMKVTNYLAKFIKNEYEIKPINSNYDQAYLDLYAKSLYAIFSRTYDINKLLEYMKQYDVTVLIDYNKKSAIYMDQSLYELLTSFGLDFSLTKQNIIYTNEEISNVNEVRVNINNHKYEFIDENLWIDDKWIDTQGSSLRFVVIDNGTGYPVDNFEIEFLDQIYVNRK